ncbi:MAG: glycosyltransferase family 2 protein [Candidatus Pristimantibacillus sp.]
MATASVCIVTYNSVSDIEACLDAVQLQSFPVKQIVVVDNASTDGTVELIRGLSQDKLLLIPNKINNGFAGGQNQAISHANSDYVLVLNPDVTLEPNYLSEIISFMEQHKEVGSATGKLIFGSDLTIMDSAGLGMRRTRQAYDLAAGEPITSWVESMQVFGVSGAAGVYRSEMVRDIAIDGQFFDEDFFAYKEDVDVAWRAKKLGWQSYYVSTAEAVHNRGWKKGGRTAVPLFVRRHSYQNRFFTLIKNEPVGWHWFTLLPLLIFVELIKLGYIILREPGLLHCWPKIIRMLPSMLRKRRWIIGKYNQITMQQNPSAERRG